MNAVVLTFAFTMIASFSASHHTMAPVAPIIKRCEGFFYREDHKEAQAMLAGRGAKKKSSSFYSSLQFAKRMIYKIVLSKTILYQKTL